MSDNLIFSKPPHELSEEELNEAITKLRSMRMASRKPKKANIKIGAKKVSKEKEAKSFLDNLLGKE